MAGWGHRPGNEDALDGSSRTNSATEISAMRCRRSFARHRRMSGRIEDGTSAGSAAQSGSCWRIAAIVSDAVSPGKMVRLVSIS